jgi:hypothetical protein
MKKKLLIIIALLAMIFSFSDIAYARRTAYEKQETGFDLCVRSGYTAKECLKFCGNRNKTYEVTLNNLVDEALDENNIARLYSYEELVDEGYFGTYLKLDDDKAITVLYTETNKESKEAFEKLMKKAGGTITFSGNSIYESEGGSRSIRYVFLGAKTKSHFGDGYGHIVEWKYSTSISKKYLVCEDDSGSFDFECDMNGTGSEFTIYVDFDKVKDEDGDLDYDKTNQKVISGKSIGGVRSFSRMLDPDQLYGWFDAVMQKFDVYDLEPGKHTFGFCLAKLEKKRGEQILDEDNRDKYDPTEDEAKGCRYLGEVDIKESLEPEDIIKETKNPKCYKMLHIKTSTKPYYYTTVWSKRSLEGRCGFHITDWNKADCRDGDLQNAITTVYPADGDSQADCPKSYVYSCTNPEDESTCMCRLTLRIAHSGYDGVADYYTTEELDKEDIVCDNFRGLHTVYRIIILAAPLLTIFFIIFDLVKTILAGDEKKMAKFRETLIKRIIALVILILLPVLIRVIVSTLSSRSKSTNLKRMDLIKCMVLGKKSN